MNLFTYPLPSDLRVRALGFFESSTVCRLRPLHASLTPDFVGGYAVRHTKSCVIAKVAEMFGVYVRIILYAGNGGVWCDG
jgi:hypothetical protein